MSKNRSNPVSSRLYMGIRARVLAVADRFGLKVSRRSCATDDMLALAALLESQGVDLILDVGANVGQFAEKVFEAGYRKRIRSYEPLSRPYGILLTKCSANPNWDVEQLCIGEAPGEAELQISYNEIASSLLDVTPALRDFDPAFEYVDSETVEVQTLDVAARAVLETAERPFLKVDVQGFEEQVLRGGEETLARCVGLQIELSFVELYAGQMLFGEMLQGLEQKGFTVYRLYPAYIDTRDGRWLQADGLFFRD